MEATATITKIEDARVYTVYLKFPDGSRDKATVIIQGDNEDWECSCRGFMYENGICNHYYRICKVEGWHPISNSVYNKFHP